MAKTREIKKRIKAVGNIRRITKTMQMIATAKFSAAQGRVVASRPYTDALFKLVTDLAAASEGASHPLLNPPASGAQPLTLVLTSDRGLCGPYNSAVLRAAMSFFRGDASAKGGQIDLVGKKGAGALKFNRIPVARQHTQFGDKPTYEAVEALAQDYIDRYVAGQVSTVRVIYTKFVSAGKQVPTVLQLLPFQADAAAAIAEKSKTQGVGSAGSAQIYEFSRLRSRPN
jgi:F-type H+-transporting ATPase subunit gamma